MIQHTRLDEFDSFVEMNDKPINLYYSTSTRILYCSKKGEQRSINISKKKLRFQAEVLSPFNVNHFVRI